MKYGIALKMFDTNINFPEEGLTVSCEVEALGDSKFKLLEHPICATQAKYGDVILADYESENKLKFLQVVVASEFEILDFILSKEISESENFKKLLNSLTEKDVFWQQDFGGIFCFCVKPNQVEKTKQFIQSALD